MRKQEFNSKLISLLPLDEVPVHVPLRRPRPLRFERLRVGGEGKADANLTNFLSTCCAWHPNSPPRPGEAPHPAPSARKSATQTAQKTALCAPASTQEVRNPKIGQQLGAQRTPRFRGMIEALIEALHALHFLLPTGDSRSGRRSFDSKLISLLPLDEAPVHVHHFAARAPCDSKGSECQCGIHRAEADSALRSRKTERAAKEKPTPISQIFF